MDQYEWASSFTIPGDVTQRQLAWSRKDSPCGGCFAHGSARTGFRGSLKVPKIYNDYKELARIRSGGSHHHCSKCPALRNDGHHGARQASTSSVRTALCHARRGRQDDCGCRANGVLLLYAESLLFTPKYVKAKEMADSGAFGRVHLIKQSEKHFGPHAEWFWM